LSIEQRTSTKEPTKTKATLSDSSHIII